MPTPTRRARRSVEEGLTLEALLDRLEEPSAEHARLAAAATRAVALATAARPRVADVGRQLATAAAASALLLLVPLAALLVVCAEKAADAVAGADLPGRAATWAERARILNARMADQLEAWSARAVQWGLGPRGFWPARRPAAGALRLDGPRR